MKKILALALFLLAGPVLAQTDTPTPSSTPTASETPTPTLTPTRTATPLPPHTTQIDGLPDGGSVVSNDEFVVDKDVSGVRRTRKVYGSYILDFTKANYFGNDINAEELAAEDFGDFTCDSNPGGCLIDPNTVALGTDTTGNYLASVGCGAGITGCVAAAESAAPTLAAVLGTSITEDELEVTNSPTANFCLTSDGGTGFTWATCASGAVSAGGSDQQVQFNDGGVLSGDSGLTYDKTANDLTVLNNVVAFGDLQTVGSLRFNGTPRCISEGGGDVWVDIACNDTFGGSDYLLSNPPSAQDLTCTNCIGATEIDGAGLESEIEAVVDLQDLQGAVTDGQVPNNITVDLATSASDLTCTNCIGATEIDGASLESEVEAVADLQDFQGAVTDAQVPNTITLSAATIDVTNSTMTGAADDKVILGTASNAVAYTSISDCTTGKLLYTQSTNTFSCGTDAVGVGGSGVGEYNVDNYPTATVLERDEFTSGDTLTWTQQNADTQAVGHAFGSVFLDAQGNTDAWHGITTPAPAETNRDWIFVAKINPRTFSATTRGCGISIGTSGTAAVPTEINSMYLRCTTSTNCSFEHLDHDDYDFAGTTSISTTVVAASTESFQSLMTRHIYLLLWWIDATDDIAARWSWDGITWEAMTTDTTTDGQPVFLGLFTRDDAGCDFEFARVLDSDSIITVTAATTLFKIGGP